MLIRKYEVYVPLSVMAPDGSSDEEVLDVMDDLLRDGISTFRMVATVTATDETEEEDDE